jgi:hypothetical protein
VHLQHDNNDQVDDIAEKINYLKNISHWIEKLIDFNGPPSSISAVENRHFTHILCFFWVDSFSALPQLLLFLSSLLLRHLSFAIISCGDLLHTYFESECVVNLHFSFTGLSSKT